MTYYEDKLTAQDKLYVKELKAQFKSAGTDSFTTTNQLFKDIYGRTSFDNILSNHSSDRDLSFSDSVDEYTIYYRSETENNILTRVNQLGQLVELIVPEDYELNAELGDLELKSKWINEIYKQVLIGDEHHGIYIKPEPIEMQIYDEKGNVKLPVVGNKGMLRDMRINPIPRRILPAMVLYRIFNLHIERQLAKYKSPVELIPKGLLAAQDGNLKANWFYKLADSTMIYDEQKFSGTELKNAYQIVGNPGIGNIIRDLIDLRDSIKAEAWELANMNDARFGSSSPSTTVRNNEQNLYRAKLGALLMVTTFNNMLGRLHQLTLDYGTVVYNEGVSGSLMGADRTIKHFNIPGGKLTNCKFGIFVTNSVLEKGKLDEYKKLAFASAQNGDPQLADAAIASDHVPEIRKAIRKFSELNQKLKEEQAALDRQSQEAIAKQNAEVQQKAIDARLAEIKLKEQMITDRDIEVANIKNKESII